MLKIRPKTDQKVNSKYYTHIQSSLWEQNDTLYIIIFA